MTWTHRYSPPDINHWQGRADAPANSTFFQCIKLVNLQQALPTMEAGTHFALLGFCCDEGIRRNLGRTGAALGPQSLREMLAKLPLQRDDVTCSDAGDITCMDGNLEEAQHDLGEVVALLLQHGFTPILLGGGHEIAYGHYQGISKQFTNVPVSIINLDAHLDMRPLLAHHQGSSGTPFLQIANLQKTNALPFNYYCLGMQLSGNSKTLLDNAVEHEVNVLTAQAIYNEPHKTHDFVEEFLQKNKALYVSLCLDVFAAAFAPGVSAPQVMGLTPWHVVPLLQRLASSGKVVSYDIAELSPKYDIDFHTAKLAAQLVYTIVHFHRGFSQ